MFRSVAILVSLPVLLVCLVAAPLGMMRGPYQWLCSSVALALTLPPAVATFLASVKINRRSPYGRVVSLVMGTLVRVMVGFGGGLVVFFASGTTFREDPLSFWFWLMGAYLVTLAMESVLLFKK